MANIRFTDTGYFFAIAPLKGHSTRVQKRGAARKRVIVQVL